MSKRPSQTSRFYSRIGSNGWSGSGYFTYSVQFSAFRRWIAAQLPTEKKTILSIGCGTGILENHLKKSRHEVVGLDASARMLARARERGLKSVVQGDSHSLPFAVDSFDIVMFVESVGYLDMPTAFSEARRVLRRHGRMLITTYTDNVEVHAAYRKFRLSEIMSSLTAAGFGLFRHYFIDAKLTAMTKAPAYGASSLLCVWSTKQ